jgi:hypothetical protein
MQAWQVYLEELRQRVPDGAADVFGREQLISEAAHDAYQRAADRMTRDHGWEDERTLVVMRGLNAAVKEWIDRGGQDWDALGNALRGREEQAHPPAE